MRDRKEHQIAFINHNSDLIYGRCEEDILKDETMELTNQEMDGHFDPNMNPEGESDLRPEQMAGHPFSAFPAESSGNHNDTFHDNIDRNWSDRKEPRHKWPKMSNSFLLIT